MDEKDLPTLTYATPGPPSGSGLAAGIWITVAGLALIFLGGCFCIGVMITMNIGAVAGTISTGPHLGFVTLLYVLAFSCFGTAGFVLFLGIRKLVRIGQQ